MGLTAGGLLILNKDLGLSVSILHYVCIAVYLWMSG